MLIDANIYLLMLIDAVNDADVYASSDWHKCTLCPNKVDLIDVTQCEEDSLSDTLPKNSLLNY